MEWKIALSEPDLGADEISAVTAVLESKWLTMGAVTSQFEKAFAEKMKVKHAFAVNNATAALHLANLVLGVGTGDEVICPALTFVASANATRYTGADVVFADIVSANDFTIDPESIESNITNKTKAITIVHYAGFSCHMERILEIAAKHKLKIIEDCAHSPFAQYEFADKTRKFLGSIGDVGCFSFFGNKNMTTGEGGMITTNSDEIASKIKLLRSHGMTTLTYERHKGHASGYDVISLGYNYRSDEIHSAIGLCQLKKIDVLNERRRTVYLWYIQAFKDATNVIVPFSNRNIELSSCHIMPVIIKGEYAEVKTRLTNARIQSSKHYDLITSFSSFKQDFNSKVTIIQDIITLPLSPFMSKEQVEEIASIVIGLNQPSTIA